MVMSVLYGWKSTKKQAAVAAGQSRIRIMTLSGCRGRFQMQGFDLKVLGLEFRPMIFRKDLNALILYCVINPGIYLIVFCLNIQ